MIYRLAKIIGVPLFKLYFRLSSSGNRNLPEGAFIIAANHSSFIDPLVIAACLKRKISYLMLSSFYYSKWIHWFCKNTGTIPVEQNRRDLKALRKAIGVLQEGRIIGIFPEGRRSKDGSIGSPLPGLGLLAAKAEVPVVPVTIKGAFNAYPVGKIFPRPCKIEVVFNTPLFPDEFPEDKSDISRMVMNRIKESLSESS